jgi:DNA-binding winged helix-turn-helix (wHTH) protein
VEDAVQVERVRFGAFEVDFRAGELRRNGVKLKLGGQPFQVLAILLEQPGQVVTREQLQNRLWPDTFVDVEHNLNTVINKIREVLGDSAETPRFIETLPRRGYRFVYPVETTQKVLSDSSHHAITKDESHRHQRTLAYGAIVLGVALLVLASILFLTRPRASHSSSPHPFSRLTFDAGLQLGPTWSPDGRLIAYASDRGGKLDIWVQQVSGGEPVQLTHSPGNNWQPSWSPDGKYIAYSWTRAGRRTGNISGRKTDGFFREITATTCLAFSIRLELRSTPWQRCRAHFRCLPSLRTESFRRR